ncbi:MAG: coenzyme F420-0:L-glutamate ligase [Patescibacteria group bacterium]
MLVKPVKTRIFKQGEDLVDFIARNVKFLHERDVLAVTSKIVSLAEGRVVEIKNEKTREKLIKAESQYAMRTPYTWLTIRDGMVMSSAGVDESNAAGKIILLPKDCYKSAAAIRKEMLKRFKLKKLGVLITDSRLLPLRAGIVGVAMGYAGFKGQKRYQGTKDLFGRELKVSRTDVADSLATASVLVMGEGNECQPLAVISDAPIEFCEKTNRHELDIDIKEDLYQPLFERIKRIRY